MRFSDRIEPGAVGSFVTMEAQLDASVAISLRRIADAAEKIAAAGAFGEEIGRGIGGELEQIMFSCGQQFHRGNMAG